MSSIKDLTKREKPVKRTVGKFKFKKNDISGRAIKDLEQDRKDMLKQYEWVKKAREGSLVLSDRDQKILAEVVEQYMLLVDQDLSDTEILAQLFNNKGKCLQSNAKLQTYLRQNPKIRNQLLARKKKRHERKINEQLDIYTFCEFIAEGYTNAEALKASGGSISMYQLGKLIHSEATADAPFVTMYETALLAASLLDEDALRKIERDTTAETAMADRIKKDIIETRMKQRNPKRYNVRQVDNNQQIPLVVIKDFTGKGNLEAVERVKEIEQMPLLEIGQAE